jgi:hypothetical protein
MRKKKESTERGLEFLVEMQQIRNVDDGAAHVYAAASRAAFPRPAVNLAPRRATRGLHCRSRPRPDVAAPGHLHADQQDAR